MKKFFVFSPIVVLILSLLICGCEDSGSYYGDESYVSVVVRNDWMRQVKVFVGNAEFDQLLPGEACWVPRSLIGDECFSITIWFLNSYGYLKIESDQYWFDREYNEYHMNITAPPNDIQVY